jgi:hypothetical protein
VDIVDDNIVSRKQLALTARGLAVFAIAAAAALGIAMPIDIGSAGPLTVGAPAPLSPDGSQGDGPAPNPDPRGPLHHYCLAVGGAGHGISSSKVCWWGHAPAS